MDKLPTLKQHFYMHYFLPVSQESNGSISREQLFEEAKERYELAHGHAYPRSYRTFERDLHKEMFTDLW